MKTTARTVIFSITCIAICVATLIARSPSSYASSFLTLAAASSNKNVEFFENTVSEFSKQQRWTSNVDIYNKKGNIKSYGKYTYDKGSVRRVFSMVKSNVSFVMISDGKISCERSTSAKFPDTLQADLEAEWLCSKSGNPEAVRLLYSFRPVGVMATLSAATEGKVRFTIDFKEKQDESSVLTISPSKVKNIKTSKIVFTAEGRALQVDVFNKKRKSSQYYISPSADADFVTSVDDVIKKWK